MTISTGTHLGPFEVVDLLGAGGMGAVYRAYDPRLRRKVAIKVLPPAFSRDPDRLHRFEQEALAVARLTSQHRRRSRHRHARGLALYRHGTARRGNAAPENQGAPADGSPMPRVRRSDCARLGGCARARHSPRRTGVRGTTSGLVNASPVKRRRCKRRPRVQAKTRSHFSPTAAVMQTSGC